MYFYFFVSPLGKGRGPLFEQLEFPLSKDALCKVWLKLVRWFWGRRLLKFINVFSLFSNYLPFEKGVALHLKKLEFAAPKGAKFGCNWPSGSGEEDF